MPRCSEAMKDAGGCEKLRGVANQTLIRRCPNGETRRGEQLRHLRPEFIGPTERTRGSETSQYPEEKKTTSDSRSSGERTGRNKPKPRSRKCPRGCGSAVGPPKASGSAWKGAPECVIAAYAKARGGRAGYPSKAGHVQSCLNLPGPSGKAKYY